MPETKEQEAARRGELTVAILGLGEAGSCFASELLGAGADVVGWDPQPKEHPKGLRFARSNSDAAKNADVIFSVNLASVAREVAEEVAPVLRPGQIYAELNTGSPQLKVDCAEAIEPSGALFVDVAIMAPVPPKGVRTPMMVSGPGAHGFHERLAPFGTDIAVIEGDPGRAATLKLLRSIAYKGIAAVVIECLEAARKLDLEEYARGQLATLVEAQMIDRFEEGSRKHARRRVHEMEAVEELLASLGVEPLSSHAALLRLRELTREPRPA
ncbi:MAG TPA: NAD(P)-binding domain-containing protein [Trueperaceae bacterium]